jgi:hypothetical protein
LVLTNIGRVRSDLVELRRPNIALLLQIVSQLAHRLKTNGVVDTERAQ